MITLTAKQEAILNFIKEFTERYGYGPSYREIAKHFNLRSIATVHKHIKALEAKDKIKKEANLKRTIEIIEDEKRHKIIELPLLGFIAAGKPIEVSEIKETFQLPESMINGKDAYVLRVRGNSMIEDHIQDGDYIIVEKRNYAYNGEVVVALVEGSEVTLKRIYYEKDKIRLQPANPEEKPVILSPDSVKIQGVVIGLMRKYSNIS